MASLLGFSVPSGEQPTNLAMANVSSAEIVLGNNAVFEITTNSSGSTPVPAYLRFGNAGMTAASASDILLPNNFTTFWETGSAFDRIRVFGNTGVIISVMKLSRS